MRRKPIVGISMKIYQNRISDAIEYAQSISKLEKNDKDVDLFMLPSIGTIYPVSKIFNKEDNQIKFGSQNIASISNGAITGEFSIESLLDMKGTYVEIGHSERRRLLNETDTVINKKVKLTLKNGLVPILCIGEPKETNSSALKKEFQKILSADLDGIKPSMLENSIIAYEPYWAIGKSQAANADYVAMAHKIIRNVLNEICGEIAEKIRIIYGGSVSKETAGQVTKSPNVDGVFVGRFGHNPYNFQEIVNVVKASKLK